MKRTLFLLCLVAILSAGNVAGAAITVVTPSSMDGWAFTKTDDNFVYGQGTASGQMVNGPASPPLGSTGSANFDTNDNGIQSAQLRNSDWSGTPVNALTDLRYSTYVTDWNGQQAPYLLLYVSTGDVDNPFDRLVFEPDYTIAQGGTAAGIWQNWNALSGKWYSDLQGGQSVDEVFNLTDYIYYNSATMIDDLVHSLGGIRITSGLGSDTDHFNTNVDAFTIGTLAGTTTYDFEAAAPVPETSSLMVWSLLGLTIGGGSWWRRKQSA